MERIGGTKPIPIDIRVICATNKNIEQMVEEGTFREDLYYRLNIIPIELPPLRKRKEDLPALIEYYIAYYNQKLGKSMRGVSPEALQTLTSYDWPGNVREMKNIIEYLENGGKAMIFSDYCRGRNHSAFGFARPYRDALRQGL